MGSLTHAVIQHEHRVAIHIPIFSICSIQEDTYLHTYTINLTLQVAIQMTDSKSALFNTKLLIFVKRIYPCISKKNFIAYPSQLFYAMFLFFLFKIIYTNMIFSQFTEDSLDFLKNLSHFHELVMLNNSFIEYLHMHNL